MLTMHPGEYIHASYLEPLDMTHTELADRLDVSVSTISRVINGKADVTPAMAVRLSYVLGRSAESWLSMQSDYSLAVVESSIDTDKLKTISTPQNIAMQHN